MSRYIVLINWTDQGVRNVKDTLKRLRQARKAFEKRGGKLEAYYTMGQYDIVGIVEAPSDEVLTELLMGVGAAGNVRTNTLRAFTESEIAKILRKV